jgi:large subunit ribosomal protein L29
MIKIKELRQKSANELEVMLRENREKVRQLSFDLASKKLKNTNELKFVKRQIAQILTILKDKKA